MSDNPTPQYEKSISVLNGDMQNRDDVIAQYIHKKVERITAALYLVTNLIPGDEPIRIEIRGLSVRLVSSTFLGSETEPSVQLRKFLQKIGALVTLLNLARNTHYISDMNHAVIHKELDTLNNFVLQHKDVLSTTSTRIKDNYFTISPHEIGMEMVSTKKTKGSGTLDEKPISQPQGIYKETSLSKKKDKGQIIPKATQSSVTERKQERKNVILALLKQQKKISVKDVAGIITDCSEKTLQRELLALVHEGVLKKEGERRWSMYSVAH